MSKHQLRALLQPPGPTGAPGASVPPPATGELRRGAGAAAPAEQGRELVPEVPGTPGAATHTAGPAQVREAKLFIL